MLTPDFLDQLPDRVVELYSQLEIRILEDMARRIVQTDALTDTAKWQAWRLQAMGAEQEFIRYHLERLTGKTQGELNALFLEAGEEALSFDDQIYRAAGLSPRALEESESLRRVISAGLSKTMQLFENLTRTTANTATRQFEHALDEAYMDVTSGAFSYRQAIRRAVKSLSGAGLHAVRYPSGHVDKMDVAVRRAVLTGVNQTAAQLQLARAEELGSDLVETTAHAGARPSHMVWQGKVFSLSGKSRRYPPFSQTGYGTGAGLCGWNCRHSFFPYFEGLSEEAYSRAELREFERRTVTYNGKTLSYYEASQVQREIERNIRKWKREYLALSAAGLDTSAESGRLAFWRAKQRDFLAQTGLAEDSFRSQVYGFGRSQAAKARAEAEKRYTAWLHEIGADDGNAPKTLAKYYEAKYNNTPAYVLLTGYSRAVEKGDISPLVGFRQYSAVAREADEKLVGITLTNGETISSYTTHFLDRVIGQTADAHQEGKRTGVPIDVVRECLLTSDRISPLYQVEMPDGSMDIRINVAGKTCSVAISIRDHRLIQTNPKG